MEPAEVLFSFAYAIFSACIVIPPTEFVSAGLTVQNIFSDWLGSEDIDFVHFHIRRTTATLLVHSLIPLGYWLGLCVFSSDTEVDFSSPFQLNYPWLLLPIISILLPLIALIIGFYWAQNQWCNHPVARLLAQFAPTNCNWTYVMSSINIEFRRIDKFAAGPYGRRVFVTDSWILLTSTYTIRLAHHTDDVHLALLSSEDHQLSHHTSSGIQTLSIRVTSLTRKIPTFIIRLHAVEYRDLKDKLRSPIQNARHIVIRQSLSEQFVDAFRQQVLLNPTVPFTPDTERESCIGCMLVVANVKLSKQCDEVASGECKQCFCRPMWCLDCMGKWFASRQDQQHPETWMACRSPCPTCRSTFCVLDVCRIV